MLVLTRKKNESIIIDDVIKVTVVEIRGDKVRLGIEAPHEIEVHRQEIYEQIHRKRDAAGGPPPEPPPSPPPASPPPPPDAPGGAVPPP